MASNTVIYSRSFGSHAIPTEPQALGWLAERRRRAYQHFERLGFPTAKSEDWKFLSLDPVLGVSFAEPLKRPVALKGDEFKAMALAEGEPRLVFVNGVYAPLFSSSEFLPHGVFFESLSENLELVPDFVEPTLGARVEKETNVFALINTFSFKDGALIFIPRGMVLEKPLHVVFAAAGQTAGRPSAGGDAPSQVFYPRVLIVLEEGARAAVVVDETSHAPGRFFSNAVTEVFLGEGASLNYNVVQHRSPEALGFTTGRFYLEKESSLEIFQYAQGGALTRNESQVYFEGEKASVSMKALAVLSGNTQVHHVAEVCHLKPFGTSRQYTKNILTDKARSEFNSLVRVAPGAQKSDSNQLNRNLLLSDTAQCFTRPRLQIDADDVSCTHGATVGQIEKDEIFYLKSRGLSEKEARFLLTYGFAEEIVEAVTLDPLRAKLEALVNGELKRFAGRTE
ncbi:MAG: Fe-S cluster assembly protein SufD [Candidatus Omnitrophica bacterium]|nr:Fe-S cluster assembly protein SufD [Candidatus Omnitrophota bacterium]